MAIPAWQKMLTAEKSRLPTAAKLAAVTKKPATSLTAPGAPPVTNAPIPGVDVYGPLMARAQNAYDVATSQVKGTLTQNLGVLGFNADGSVNGQNAYGQYQQNRRAAGQAAEQQAGRSTARGLGQFGGLADQDRNESNYQSGVGLNNVLNEANRQNLSAQQAIQSEGVTLQDRLAQAQLTAAQTNIENRNFTQAGPAATPAAAAAKPGTFTWAGQTITNKAQLTSILAKSGVTYAAWAKNHPSAAATLKK